MSRTVITDIVMPIVSEILQKTGYTTFSGHAIIRDEQLEQFLEEEMQRWFGVIGADGCQHLKEQLQEALKNDPFEFRQLLRELLRKYVKLQVKIRQAKSEHKESAGPPDRFSEQRRRYSMLLEQRHESEN